MVPMAKQGENQDGSPEKITKIDVFSKKKSRNNELGKKNIIKDQKNLKTPSPIGFDMEDQIESSRYNLNNTETNNFLEMTQIPEAQEDDGEMFEIKQVKKTV